MRNLDAYIQGYDDGFPGTAPVMSFLPNALGLYDLGGNVWEVVTPIMAAQAVPAKPVVETILLRGASFNIHDSGQMLSSFRRSSSTYQLDFEKPDYGFRIVLETE